MTERSDQPSVAILGASPNPERTSALAVERYLAAGWTVWPLHPQADAINGLPVYRELADLPGRPDILSLYLRPALLAPLIPAIQACNPQLIYCNPGADDPALVAQLNELGLATVVACNLVALTRGDPRERAAGA